MKKGENSDAFSKLNHKHRNLIASLDYAHINKLIIYTLQSMNEKHPSTCCPAAKKHSMSSIVNIGEKPAISLAEAQR